MYPSFIDIVIKKFQKSLQILKRTFLKPDAFSKRQGFVITELNTNPWHKPLFKSPAHVHEYVIILKIYFPMKLLLLKRSLGCARITSGVFISSSLPSSTLAFSSPAVSLPSSTAIPPDQRWMVSFRNCWPRRTNNFWTSFSWRSLRPGSSSWIRRRRVWREKWRGNDESSQTPDYYFGFEEGEDESPKSFHYGPGEGELYNPRPQKSSAPGRRSPRKLQSVVRVVPRPIRPRH